MEIALNKLLEGKSTIIKNKTYLTTSEYITPFITEMSKLTTDFKMYAVMPQQITKSKDSDDITYNKVLIQAILPTKIEGYNEVCCLCYGLDMKQPIYKLYRGYIDKDNNFYCFNGAHIQIYELLPETKLKYDIKLLLEKPSNFKEIIPNLNKIKIDNTLKLKSLGDWIENCILSECILNLNGKVKLSTNDVVKVYNELYIDELNKKPVDGEYTVLYVYTLFSKLIKEDEKDILNKFEKTLLIKNILKTLWIQL